MDLSDNEFDFVNELLPCEYHEGLDYDLPQEIIGNSDMASQEDLMMPVAAEGLSFEESLVEEVAGEVAEEVDEEVVSAAVDGSDYNAEHYSLIQRLWLQDKWEKRLTRAESKFRIRSKQLFLTFAECPIDKTCALWQLMTRWEYFNLNVQKYIIAQEKHQNGNFHLHCYFQFEVEISVTDNCFADMWLAGNWYHGNYQSARCPKNVAKYCTKDGDFLSNFDVATYLNCAKQKRKQIATDLLVKGLPEVMKSNPELIFEYSRLKANIESYQMDIQGETPEVPALLPNNWGCLLPFNKANKRRHYWIYSTTPNKGKTTWAHSLVEKYQATFVGGDRGFFDVDKSKKILIFDEFTTARITYTQMNQMCDGTYKFAYFRQGNVLLKDKQPLLIVLANKPIAEVYRNHVDTVYARFIEVNLDTSPPTFDSYKNLNGV